MSAKTSIMIYRPTIKSLKQMLEDLTELGWHEDQQIQIAQMANAPEAFAIMAVEKWIGEAS
jgi:tRNA A58 N-methylase Trm61